MITVTLPGGFQAERNYVFHVILHELLGLGFEIRIEENIKQYIIEFDGKRIEIRDAFFGAFRDGETYLHEEALPGKVLFTRSAGIEDQVCIYGEDQFTASDERIACGIDLIAGAFFMLSRWEEYVDKRRDQHGRFSGERSVAFRHGFLHRPVVNEYSRLLKQWLLTIGVPRASFRTREFQLLLQSDVDTARFWTSPLSVFPKLGFRIFRQGSLPKAAKELAGYVRYLRGDRDPYDTFDALMDIAESTGNKACFFFPVGGDDKYDNEQILSDPHVRESFAHIREREHQTGIHYSYHTAHHPEIMQLESGLYRRHDQDDSLQARQHYLRCSVPETWQAWEDAGVETDFTMGYPEAPGFRCGICQPFPLFNVGTRKMLSVYESPLIAMDVTFRMYLDTSPDEMIRICRELRETVREHNGDFVFLWHNSSFGIDWEGWELVPEAVLENV